MHILISMGERCYYQHELKYNHSSHLFAGDTVIGNTQEGYVNRDRERSKTLQEALRRLELMRGEYEHHI